MANRASAHCAVSLYKFPYLHFENGHARVTHGARRGKQSRPYGSHPVENTVWEIFETLWGPSKVLERVFTSRDRNVYWLLLKSKAVFFLVCRKSVGLPFRHETRTATNPSFWGVTKLDCPKAFFSQMKRNPNLHSTHDSFFARALHLEKMNP